MSVFARFGMAFLCLALAACEEGTGTTGTDGGTGGTGGTTTTITIGSGGIPSGAFTAGVLDITDTTITSGGSTFIFVSLVDDDDNGYGDATITFTSTCSLTDLATFTNQQTILTGLTRVTYTADGCTTSDDIVASTVIDGETIGATGTITISPILIGSGEPPSSSFTAGVLDIVTPTIAADGSTDIQVSLADASGNLYEGSADIYFTSPCIAAGTATMTSPVSTSDGTVTATYNAAGCLGTDLVQAATTVDGTALSVSDTVTVLATSGATISLGTGSGGSFSAGDLDIAITSLSAGGTTGITVNLADSDNGNLYQTPTAITFTANCTTSTNHGSIDSPVASSGGSVSTDYTALGCNGDVTITASATVDGEATTATGTITVAVGTANSLQFVSADPANIALQGYSTGDRPEVSTVTFKLLDTDNNPLQGELVNFTLNTGVGGITLTSASGTTNASGLVTTKVNSGNVATTVRVTATLDSDNTIATQSDTLTISTGIADQNSFSIASNRLSPEALIHNGPTDIESCDEANAQCSQISMIASDHFNNPVPDGTAIYFTTEGGTIQPSCETTGGGCSVWWMSSQPKPGDGRVTILATAIGEEWFIDSNGSGMFDDGEYFQDLPEAWRDDDEDGVFDFTGAADDEESRDFNENSSYDGIDGLYNGILCEGPTECDGVSTTTYVRTSIVLTMSGSNATIGFDNTGDKTSDIAGTTPVLDVFAADATDDGYFIIHDANGNPMPSGTTITVTSNDDGISITSGESHTVNNSNLSINPVANTRDDLIGSIFFYLQVQNGPGADAETTSSITVDVTTPDGSTTSKTIFVDSTS